MSAAPLESIRATHRTRPLVAALAAVLLSVMVLGCGSSTDGSAPASTLAEGQTTSSTAGEAAAPGTTEAGGRCVSRIPGEILSAADAVVHFSPSQVCPGYVTIAPGTPVTFVNEDTQAHTVTITEGNLPDGAVVDTGTVGPGESWVRAFDTLGTFTYATDAIPSFRGAVEVTTGDTSHGS